MLASAIIGQAVRDYQVAVEKNDVNGKDGINALRLFFKSDWCEALLALCIGLDISYSGDEVLSLVDKMVRSNIEELEKNRKEKQIKKELSYLCKKETAEKQRASVDTEKEEECACQMSS